MAVTCARTPPTRGVWLGSCGGPGGTPESSKNEPPANVEGEGFARGFGAWAVREAAELAALLGPVSAGRGEAGGGAVVLLVVGGVEERRGVCARPLARGLLSADRASSTGRTVIFGPVEREVTRVPSRWL